MALQIIEIGPRLLIPNSFENWYQSQNFLENPIAVLGFTEFFCFMKKLQLLFHFLKKLKLLCDFVLHVLFLQDFVFKTRL